MLTRRAKKELGIEIDTDDLMVRSEEAVRRKRRPKDAAVGEGKADQRDQINVSIAFDPVAESGSEYSMATTTLSDRRDMAAIHTELQKGNTMVSSQVVHTKIKEARASIRESAKAFNRNKSDENYEIYKEAKLAHYRLQKILKRVLAAEAVVDEDIHGPSSEDIGNPTVKVPTPRSEMSYLTPPQPMLPEIALVMDPTTRESPVPTGQIRARTSGAFASLQDRTRRLNTTPHLTSHQYYGMPMQSTPAHIRIPSTAIPSSKSSSVLSVEDLPAPPPQMPEGHYPTPPGGHNPMHFPHQPRPSTPPITNPYAYTAREELPSGPTTWNIPGRYPTKNEPHCSADSPVGLGETVG
jgi:hypothetical protein